jgi:multiple antibiotic resistance protein
VFALAVTFFLIANPVGNTPAIIALVKDFDFRRQRVILFRESIFALILALFFQYFGEVFLQLLHIQDYAVTLAGGVLLLIVAFSMILVISPVDDTARQMKQEPFIVPIATPIISGPGLLAVIMLKSRLAHNSLEVTFSILIAFAGVIAVLAIAPYLQKLLGKRGLIALEQVMGMVLALIAVEMIVKGSALLLKAMYS